MTQEELAKLGIVTGSKAQQSSHARVLLMGQAKTAGKTTTLALTAPKPLIINCDGGSSTKGAVSLGAGDRFLVVAVNSEADLTKAIRAAEQAVKAGAVETVILDTITLLSSTLLRELEGRPGMANDTRALYGALKKSLVNPVSRLCRIPAHVFVVAHLTPLSEAEEGVLPSIDGSAKTAIPALLDDFIKLDYKQGRKPDERQFFLGPQGDWSGTGRHIKASKAIKADVMVLLAELGFGAKLTSPGSELPEQQQTETQKEATEQ